MNRNIKLKYYVQTNEREFSKLMYSTGAANRNSKYCPLTNNW
jgi:hypothetical protein